MRQCQLRIYKIKEGLMQEWVDRWRDEIKPAREQYGFELIGAWTSGSDEFVWIIAGGDAHQSFDDLEAAYRAARAAVGEEGFNPMDYLASTPQVHMMSSLSDL